MKSIETVSFIYSIFTFTAFLFIDVDPTAGRNTSLNFFIAITQLMETHIDVHIHEPSFGQCKYVNMISEFESYFQNNFQLKVFCESLTTVLCTLPVLQIRALGLTVITVIGYSYS